jgi:hypothetical protein
MNILTIFATRYRLGILKKYNLGLLDCDNYHYRI